jgi:hypothetical protein
VQELVLHDTVTQSSCISCNRTPHSQVLLICHAPAVLLLCRTPNGSASVIHSTYTSNLSKRPILTVSYTSGRISWPLGLFMCLHT